MELFSLVAKLTLDSKEYYKALNEAENKASGLDIDEPELTLNTDSFDTEIALASEAKVTVETPTLDLDDQSFDDKITDDQAEEVENLDSPTLDLDDQNFDDKVTDDQAEKVENLDSPKLDLDDAGFKQGVEDAQVQGEGFGETMEGVFKGIKSALTVTGIVAAVTGIVKGLKEAIDLTAATADGIDKGSKRLGISTQAYQEWDHALRQSGSGITDLSRGIKTFQKILTAAEPGAVLKDAQDAMDGIADDGAGISKDVAQAFAQLGLSSKIANKEITTTEELMQATLMALADFKGTKEQRGVLTRALFGNNADGLNALLDEGAQGVQQLLSEASDLGLVMDETEITNAVKYGDAVANLNAELDAIKTAFVSDIIPVLTDAVTWLTDFLTKLNPRLQTSSVYAVFDNIDKKSLAATVKLDQSTESAKKLIEDLQNMGDYWSLDEQGRMTWDALAAKALELFPQLSKYIDDDGHIIRGNTQDIEANIDAWARLEKQRILSSAMDEKSEAVAKQLTAAYEKGAEAAIKGDEAYGKMKTAITQMNTALEDNEMLKTLLRGEFGTDVITESNAAEMLSWIKKQGYDTKAMGAGAVDEWYSLNKEAEELLKTSQSMIEEAQKAQSELKDYEQRLSEQMGLTKSDVIKTDEAVQNYINTLKKVPTKVATQFDFIYDDFRPHAIGSAYIPWDNYPALLHRGEQVITASDARRGLSNDINYTELEDRIISAIMTGMANANVTAVVTDREVARGSNRYNGKEIESGRFRP